MFNWFSKNRMDLCRSSLPKWSTSNTDDALLIAHDFVYPHQNIIFKNLNEI